MSHLSSSDRLIDAFITVAFQSTLTIVCSHVGWISYPVELFSLQGSEVVPHTFVL